MVVQIGSQKLSHGNTHRSSRAILCGHLKSSETNFHGDTHRSSKVSYGVLVVSEGSKTIRRQGYKSYKKYKAIGRSSHTLYIEFPYVCHRMKGYTFEVIRETRKQQCRMQRLLLDE